MYEEYIVKYVNPSLSLGFQDIRTVWCIKDKPFMLIAEFHRGALYYRYPGTARRISYRMLKKGLVRKTCIIRIPVQLLPF